MAVSGSYLFQLPFDDAIDEATQRVGGEESGGLDEGRLALRSLNLLFQDWQNRGILLWTVTSAATTVAASTTQYVLSSITHDLAGAVVIRSSIATPLTRLSFNEYLNIPNKHSVGKPSMYMLDRQRDAPVLYLYRTPENSTDIISYWQIRNVQSAETMAEDPDVPRRFYPAIVSGLAYYLAQKRLELTDPGRIATLADFEQRYEKDFMRATEADRERASVILRPRLRGGWR